MTHAVRKRVVVGAIGVGVVALVAGLLVRNAVQPRAHTIEHVTLTALDAQARTAEIEFIHPKSGLPCKARGTIPEDCPIYVDGVLCSGGMADLRVGDTGSVRALLRADQSIEAQWVRVTRAVAGSQPSTTPAADPR